MTLEALEKSLPNGLHDATLEAISIDYRKREVVLDVQIDIGAAAPSSESYHPARVVFHGMQFVVIDPPGNRGGNGVSMVDAGPGQPSTAPIGLPELQESVFLVWVFLVESNSFIRIAAQDVTLQWL